VTVTFLEDGSNASSPPRVAYAIGRRAGSAVVRNRIRRRLRAVMRELVHDEDGPVLPGAYLLTAGPQSATEPYQELKNNVAAALRRATADRPGAPS
jgi:ribonuclease P protein component